MEYLNLIPIAAIVWFFWRAYSAARPRDQVDIYFQTTRYHSGKKFHNWFGITSQDL